MFVAFEGEQHWHSELAQMRKLAPDRHGVVENHAMTGCGHEHGSGRPPEEQEKCKKRFSR